MTPQLSDHRRQGRVGLDPELLTEHGLVQPGNLQCLDPIASSNQRFHIAQRHPGVERIDLGYAPPVVGGVLRGPSLGGRDRECLQSPGVARTTLSADKQPITTFEGTWTLIKGTGKHERATGRGTYKGHFTSQTQMVVDWQGELATKLANN